MLSSSSGIKVETLRKFKYSLKVCSVNIDVRIIMRKYNVHCRLDYSLSIQIYECSDT